LDRAGTEGLATYRRMMGDFMRRYLDTCSWLGVELEPKLMPPRMTQYLAQE